MFCQKCGNQVDDGAKFCNKCGNSMGNENSAKVEEKVEDNNIVLTVKSKFKLLYHSMGSLVAFIIMLLCFVPLMIAMVSSGEFEESDNAMIIGGFIGFFAFIVVIWAIVMLVRSAQYKKYSYDLYKTKITYKDSFLNVSEKEVKYKYIREITYTQSFVQRWFGIGNIVLYTNAESGFMNGIFIRSVDDVKNVYQEVKKVVNV